VNAHLIADIVLLALVVACCWIGVLGMCRMSDPTQALHYLSLPGSFGAGLLVAAAFVNLGNSSAAWKTLFIAAVLIATNSVVTHASARAFRKRQLGHWQPRREDGVEWVPQKESKS
jgi:monovalent cation/proton antiporter MnhG/PhaG subunit